MTTVVGSIEERLADAVSVANHAHRQLVDIVAEAAETGAWSGPGLRSLAHWLTWQAGVSHATARIVVRIAGARATHPLLSACWSRGELTLDQMAVAVAAPAYADREVASLAPRCTVGQIRTIVRAAQAPADVAAADRPAEYVSITHEEDGSGQIRARLEADHLRVFEAAVRAAKDRLFREGQRDATLVDGLADVCGRALDGECASRRDRFRVEVLIDPEDPVRARWDNGMAVPDAIRRFVTCDGWLSPKFTRDAKAISVGRSQRIVPDRTRRVVLRRDRGCRAPWCSQTLGVEVHHLDHWEDGGSTDRHRLIGLCSGCHRRHHLGEFTIIGEDADDLDGLRFLDRRGRPIIRPRPPNPEDRPPPSDPGARYRHPLGERLDASLLWFPDPPSPN